MSLILLIARLLLSVTFITAGTAKLLDLEGSRKALRDFGISRRASGFLGILLPGVEILTAISLIPSITAWWGGVSALALLTIFSIAIAIKLLNGESPDCHCFGQIYSKPVGWPTLTRNLCFALVAVGLVIFGRANAGLSMLDWLTRLTPGEAANLIIGMILVVFLTILLVRQNLILKNQKTQFDSLSSIRSALAEDGDVLPVEQRDVFLPREGLPVGARAPAFTLTVPDGGYLTSDDLIGRGKSLLLLFVSPNCSGCKSLIPVSRLWQRDYSDAISVAIICKGSKDEIQSAMSKYEIDQLLIDESGKVTEVYQALWTPAAVLINPDGRIGSHIIYGDQAIRGFFRNVTEPQSATSQYQPPRISLRYPARKIGEPSPHFTLPDLSEKLVTSNDLEGAPTALIFWDPACPHCASLADDLLRWESDPPSGAPQLFFISSGNRDATIEFNRRFRSSTLLDPGFDVVPLFGAESTPAAILIDAEGRIASSLAIGAENIRALLGISDARR